MKKHMAYYYLTYTMIYIYNQSKELEWYDEERYLLTRQKGHQQEAVKTTYSRNLFIKFQYYEYRKTSISTSSGLKHDSVYRWTAYQHAYFHKNSNDWSL